MLQLEVVVSDNGQKELFVPAPDTPQNKLHQELLMNLFGKDLASTPGGLQSPGMPFSLNSLNSLNDLVYGDIRQLTPHVAQAHPLFAGLDSKNTMLPTSSLSLGPLLTTSPFGGKLSAFASPSPKKFTFDIDSFDGVCVRQLCMLFGLGVVMRCPSRAEHKAPG